MSETPGKILTRKQIQEHTKIGNKVLIKFFTLLERFNVVQVEKRGRQHLYKLNMENSYTQTLMELIQKERKQLNAIHFGSLMILREFVYELTNCDFANIKKILLFGSTAKHIARVDSDLDVAIITKEKITPGEQLLHTHAAGLVEKRFKREIQTHYFTEEEFLKLRKSGHKLVTEIDKDGLVLVG